METRGRKTYDANWDRKVHKLREEFPEVNGIDWASLIKDQPMMLTNIVGGIAKIVSNEKKNLDLPMTSTLSSVYGSEYFEGPFVDALNHLWGKKTIGKMSNMTGISPAVIRHLRLGQRGPTFAEMEAIAEGFKLDPSFFMEYRIASILASIDNYLTCAPEISTAWYQKIRNRKGIVV